jgi:hypothetical protein
MKYFLVTGYRPSAHGCEHVYFGAAGDSTRRQMERLYQDARIDIPPLGEKSFLATRHFGRLSVFVHGAYDAFLLVTARSQRKAYLIATAFRAAATCILGQSPSGDSDAYLFELCSVPTKNMRRKDIVRSILQVGDAEMEPDIGVQMTIWSGTSLSHDQVAHACSISREALARPVILDALRHLGYSCTLHSGFMTGSFYQCHYSRDRRYIAHYAVERDYYENRFKYDMAFVSAFRGIECVLGKPHFKKNEVSELLANTDRQYDTSFAVQRHRSWHEVFSSKKKWWRYSDLIEYYLKLRIAVSAHGNPSPPHIVSEDQVFEIQYLLRSMISRILVVPNQEGESCE